jgi:CheY-like chemotaxis protein
MALASEKSRVLVVDDEPQITRVLRTVLTSQGYQVQTATEGETALANFTEWRPELVITDLFMPHMDGIELCKRIRSVSNVPIIVLSVKGEERAKVEALDSGADDYVTKPFGTDELLARVRAALRRGTADSEVDVFEVGDFKVDLGSRRVHAGGQGSPADTEGVRPVRLHGAASEPRHHASHAARSGVGRSVAGTTGVLARVHGPIAQEARTGSLQPAIPGHRAVGRLSIQFAGMNHQRARSTRPRLRPLASRCSLLVVVVWRPC